MPTIEQRLAALESKTSHLEKWLVPLPGKASQETGYSDEQTLRRLCTYLGASYEQVTGDTRPMALSALRRVIARDLKAAGWNPGRIGQAMKKDRKAVLRMLEL